MILLSAAVRHTWFSIITPSLMLLTPKNRPYAMFYLYAIIDLLFVIFIKLYLPETKGVWYPIALGAYAWRVTIDLPGKTLEAIQADFFRKKEEVSTVFVALRPSNAHSLRTSNAHKTSVIGRPANPEATPNSMKENLLGTASDK